MRKKKKKEKVIKLFLLWLFYQNKLERLSPSEHFQQSLHILDKAGAFQSGDSNRAPV